MAHYVQLTKSLASCLLIGPLPRHRAQKAAVCSTEGEVAAQRVVVRWVAACRVVAWWVAARWVLAVWPWGRSQLPAGTRTWWELRRGRLRSRASGAAQTAASVRGYMIVSVDLVYLARRALEVI